MSELTSLFVYCLSISFVSTDSVCLSKTSVKLRFDPKVGQKFLTFWTARQENPRTCLLESEEDMAHGFGTIN